VTLKPNGEDSLDNLYWRDEILTAMYWLQGEGLATNVDAAQLARFLVADTQLIAQHLRRLAEEGYLEAAEGKAGRYSLSQVGHSEGGRRFQDEFAELQHQGHGECSADCICHNPDYAGQNCPSHPH
jgi:hypothetical protein